MFDGVAAERPTGAGREQRIARRTAAFDEPRLEHCDGEWNERCSSLFAAFADRVNVCSGAEREVGRGELGEFGYPQTGLDSEDQQGVVASAGPCCRVAGGQDGVGFGFGEVGDERLVVAFGGDGEDTLDRCGMFGVPERGVVEQGADRG